MGRYYIKTYGCQMNVHESEKLAGVFESRGHVAAAGEEDADYILYNTCCIREKAETHVLGNLGKVKKLKEKRPEIKVVVCGCMPQKAGAAQALQKRCPFIDIIIGTHNVGHLGEYLDRCAVEGRVVEIWPSARPEPEIPSVRAGGVGAYVNIMYGCDNFCSYCIVPYVRGRERSRRENEILAEVETLLSSGYRHITLLGQNVNSYAGEGGRDFSDLLRAVCGLGGKYRVGFMTSHPKDFSVKLVRTIAACPNASRYVHLPVQAGSDRILNLMNRRYTAADYLYKVDLLRGALPDAGLSSDVMVGFPTETEEDFSATLDLVRRIRFDNLYTFIYSRRGGTAADKMADQVPLPVKTERIERLIAEQYAISDEIARCDIGRRFEILIEESGGGQSRGKTAGGKAVTVGRELSVGSWADVTVTERQNYKLYAEITGEI